MRVCRNQSRRSGTDLPRIAEDDLLYLQFSPAAHGSGHDSACGACEVDGVQHGDVAAFSVDEARSGTLQVAVVAAALGLAYAGLLLPTWRRGVAA